MFAGAAWLKFNHGRPWDFGTMQAVKYSVVNGGLYAVKLRLHKRNFRTSAIHCDLPHAVFFPWTHHFFLEALFHRITWLGSFCVDTVTAMKIPFDSTRVSNGICILFAAPRKPRSYCHQISRTFCRSDIPT